MERYGQKKVEDHAKSLIFKLNYTRKELRSVNIMIFAPYAAVQNLKEQGHDLKQKILSLCRDLGIAKGTLGQAMAAMERNAWKLASESLHDTANEQQLGRAAKAARIEAERLRKFIKKIDEALNQSEESITESDELFVKFSKEYENVGSNKKEKESSYPINDLSDSYATYRHPSYSYDTDRFPLLTKGQDPPLLDSTGPSGFEESLRKIPPASSSSSGFDDNPSAVVLNVNDSHSGSANLNHEPYNPTCNNMITGAQRWQSLAQEDFNGNYDIGPANATFQSNVSGDW